MGHEVIRGIIRRRWDSAGADTVALTSGQLRQLELLKTRLIEERRRKLNAAIERQSPR